MIPWSRNKVPFLQPAIQAKAWSGRCDRCARSLCFCPQESHSSLEKNHMSVTETPMLAHHYCLETCLGWEPMATAYRVRHLSTHQSCIAILLLLPDLDPQTRKRFLHRFQAQTEKICALPSHPLVLPLTDAGVWQGIPYL